MNEKEYESLGRYTALKEQAEGLARERNRILYELKTLIQSAIGAEGGHMYAYEFNTVKAEELVAKASRLHREMKQAMSLASDAATDCGKPALTMITY